MYQHAQQPVEKAPAPAEPAAQRRAGSESAKPYPHRFGEYALEGPPRTAAAASAAEGDVVQRAVGFEFETAVPMRTSPSDKTIPYGLSVFRSKDDAWQIKADSSNVEFVTEKVPETDDGEKQLIARMNQITQMGINMVKASKAPPNKPPLRAIWPNVGNAYKYDDESVVLAGGALTADDMLAAPQATGGVTLAQIPALIDAMVSTKLEHLKGNKRFTPQHEPPSYEEYMDLYGPMESEDIEDIGALSKEGKEAFESAQQIHNLTTKPVVEELESQGYDTTDLSYAVGANATIRFLTRARAAVQLWEQMHGDDIDRTGASTDNLDGFLTLVVSYLFNGAELTKVLPYTKSAMVLMSRTNMHSLFKLLSADEKKLFTIKTIEEISELDGGGRLFAAGFKSKGATLDGPTRAEWIDSIINGTPVAETGEALPSGSDVDETTPRVAADRLSQASKSPEALSSGSAGAQDVPDVNPHTGKNDLAVLEIRNMAKGQPLDAWRKTALTVFEMFRRLHETPEETQQRLYPQVTIHKKKTK